MFTFTKKKFLGFLSLGAQNRYTAVQTDLKYPLSIFLVSLLFGRPDLRLINSSV